MFPLQPEDAYIDLLRVPVHGSPEGWEVTYPAPLVPDPAVISDPERSAIARYLVQLPRWGEMPAGFLPESSR